MTRNKWEKRASGEGRKPTPGRAPTAYVESTTKGVKRSSQQWCYLCGEEHPYHQRKSA